MIKDNRGGIVLGDSGYEKWRDYVRPALQSKLEEFRLLGVKRLTLDELWDFVLETLAKKKEHDLMLHQFVNHIMTISVNDYMNKLRMEMFKGVDFFKEQASVKD